jgi:hypothetical protein
MKKLFLIIAIVVLSQVCKGQSKWEKTGWQYPIRPNDTVTTTYTLKGKDSVSFRINVENCNCKFYIDDFNHKKHLCKNMQRHYMETLYWHWDKSYTIHLKDTINIVKPHWVNNWSEMGMIDGTYTINGKRAYPSKILYKKGKFLQINNY